MDFYRKAEPAPEHHLRMRPEEGMDKVPHTNPVPQDQEVQKESDRYSHEKRQQLRDNRKNH